MSGCLCFQIVFSGVNILLMSQHRGLAIVAYVCIRTCVYSVQRSIECFPLHIYTVTPHWDMHTESKSCVHVPFMYLREFVVGT